MAAAKNVPAPEAVEPDNELLQRIAASLTGGLYLSAAEAGPSVAAGFATVDTAQVIDNGNAFVSLTEAGQSIVDALPPAEPLSNDNTGAAGGPVANAAAVKPAPTFVVRNDIPMPGKRRGRRGSAYPIEAMEVGQSFHIPVSAENPDPAARIASSLSNARIKFSEATGNTETVKVNIYSKDASGAILKTADGKRVIASTKTETRPQVILTRDWSVSTVDETDPEGPGARVWRTK
jgi:hypothetical protein